MAAVILISSSAQAQDLFVSDSNGGNIYKFTPGGVQSTFASGLSYPISVAFDSAGNLFEADANSGHIYKFTPGGVQSTFASGLGYPYGLAFDSAGNLFVQDDGSGNIYKFTPGGVQSTFASGLSQVYGLAFDSAGNLFVADTGYGTIDKFTPGGVKSTFASGLSYPNGLAFDNAGNLFVADGGVGNIYKFTPGGVQSTFASGLINPRGPAFDSAGNLFVSVGYFGSGNIYKFTPGGVQSIFASGLSLPQFLAFKPPPPAPAQDLFVSDYLSGNIYEFTPGGMRSTFAPALNAPYGLAFDSTGNLFEADAGSGNIYKFTPGGMRSTFASALSLPYGLAFDSAGNLFEADVGTSHIYKFTPDGTRSTFSFPLNVPYGLAVDSAGNLFEADANSGNIYKFTPDGMRSTFASGLNHPQGLAFDSAGNLFEADGQSGNIYKFTSDGVRSTFASGLNNPIGLAFDSAGNLYEADDGSGNIYKFTPGGMRSTFASALSEPTFLTFTPFPVIIGGNNLSATATVGQVFVYQITATNHPTLYAASGLPAGLSIDTVKGIIYGIPTGSPGTFSITISASNLYGTSSANLALTLQPAPSGLQIISSNSATGRTGQFFSFQVLISGATSAAQLSINPLPRGLHADLVTGLISGTPTSNGNFSVNITVTDGMASASATLQLTFTSDPTVPIVTSASNAIVQSGQSFSYTMTADATASFSYIGTDGIKHVEPSSAGLPSGLSFDGVNKISGTYTGGASPNTSQIVTSHHSAALNFKSNIRPDTITIRPPCLATIQLIGTNSKGTCTKSLNFFQATTFASWKQLYFTMAELNDPTISGDLADPDHDGLSNLLEYAFGLDPTIPSTTNLPSVISDSTYFSLIYTKALGATDLTYTIEESTDLVHWSPPTSVTPIELANDGYFQTIQAQVPRSDAGSAGKLFLRLRVSH